MLRLSLFNLNQLTNFFNNILLSVYASHKQKHRTYYKNQLRIIYELLENYQFLTPNRRIQTEHKNAITHSTEFATHDTET